MKRLIMFFAIICLLSCKTRVPKAEIDSQISPVTGNTLHTNNLDSLVKNAPYNMSGEGIFGRKIVYRNTKALVNTVNETGKVTFKVCINPKGEVVYTEVINEETTMKNKKDIRLYQKASYGYRFQEDKSSPELQCGKLSFKVDNTIKTNVR